MRKLLFFLLFQLIFNIIASAQDDFCISDTEHQLYNVVNTIRKENNLKPIPLSHSLTFVADVHAKDLYLNYNRKSKCSMHSWSDKGRWSACECNDNLFKCMNSKPKELTPYKSYGYELICYQNKPIDHKQIYKTWKNQSAILNIILQRATYSTKKWEAMGIGIFRGYISIWFGEKEDKSGAPPYCNERVGDSDNHLAQENTGAIVANTVTDTHTIPEKGESVSDSCYLILGSFDTKKDAQKAQKVLAKQVSYAVTIMHKNNKYRVALLPKDYGTVVSLKKKLKSKFPDCWIFCDK